MSIKEEIGMKDLWVRDGFKISDEKVNEDGTLEYKISNKNRLEDDAAECKTLKKEGLDAWAVMCNQFTINGEKVYKDGVLAYTILSKEEDDPLFGVDRSKPAARLGALWGEPAFKKKSFFRRLIEKWWGKCLE